jgi:bifunctional UDP-N-acetylglucosamine pyrophosphorylase/glucosamine-1-phosphate N-acetyltransferase
MGNPRAPLAAIVLAAGKGTRMKSQKAKVLHEICGRPLAFFSVRAALEVGADPVVTVVGHQAEAVEAVLGAALPGGALRFAVQQEQLGTAHAVLAARDALGDHPGPVAIVSGDTPLLTAATLRRVVEARARAGAAIAVAVMTLEDPRGYGRIVRGDDGAPRAIVEEKDASEAERAIREVNAGLYCVDGAFLWDALSRVGASNAQREFYLTDLVALAAAGPGAVAVEVPPLEAAGVNDREELSRAGRAMTARIASELMRAGVTIEDPARFDVDEGVAIGPDTVIEPGVRLRGRTRIGAGCRIGQGAVLTDAAVADSVTVKPYSVVEDAVIGARAIVGPFSRLRPGTELGEDVHVGNFVETKKARLGKGSKASHLTYLGDAVIGAGVNVGAGTITCNYDGEKKHETRIGDGAFIGSDATLVAPVEIGAGAYVGAGSTITEAVPAGALAVGRGRQVIKVGWVAARKARSHQ